MDFKKAEIWSDIKVLNTRNRFNDAVTEFVPIWMRVLESDALSGAIRHFIVGKLEFSYSFDSKRANGGQPSELLARNADF
jgi:hypothetical protein